MTRPVMELRGFRRVPLQPGETETVSFSIDANDPAFCDRETERVVEPGRFRGFAGSSSRDVREADFTPVTGGEEKIPVSYSCEEWK